MDEPWVAPETAADFDLLEIGVIVVAGVFIFFATHFLVLGANDASRLATVESLVHRGTFIIDGSPFAYTIDRAQIDGHNYSTKPPLLPLLMAGEYWVMHRLFGLDLHHPVQRAVVVKLLAFTCIGLPFIVLLVWMRKLLRWFVPHPLARVVALATCAFATGTTGLALWLNNHVPAAFALTGAAYLAVGLVHGRLRPTPLRFAAAGVLAALLPTMDLPGMFFSILVWAYLLRVFPRPTLVWFTLGALPVLALHFGLTYAISGGILPIYLRKELYDYEGSYWRDPQGIDSLNQPKLVYLFHLTLGRKGFLLLYPILWLAVVAMARAARDRVALLRGERIGYGLLVLLWLGFYTLTTRNYGGASYGVRWFIFFLPPLSLFVGMQLARIRSRAVWALVWALFGISLYSTYQACFKTQSTNPEWTQHLLGPTWMP